MSDDFKELASVDGTITATAEALIPLKDDGVYRGDGAFEVIRLYAGRPFALVDHIDRLGRSAAAIELEFDRAALEAEIERPAQRRRAGRRAAAADRHPRRSPDRRHRAGPAHAATLTVATVTYEPTVILDRGQVALLRRQHGGDAAGQSAGRRRGGPGPPQRHRARAADLDDLLGLPRGRAADHRAGRRRARLDHPRPPGQGAATSSEDAWRVEDLHAASEAFLASTTREIQAVAAIDGVELPQVPGPRTREAQEAFAATLRREL